MSPVILHNISGTISPGQAMDPSVFDSVSLIHKRLPVLLQCLKIAFLLSLSLFILSGETWTRRNHSSKLRQKQMNCSVYCIRVDESMSTLPFWPVTLHALI